MNVYELEWEKQKSFTFVEGILNGTYLGAVAERRTDSVSSEKPIKNKQIQRGSGGEEMLLKWKVSPRRLFLMSVEENEILKREVILFLALNLRWQFDEKKNEKRQLFMTWMYF